MHDLIEQLKQKKAKKVMLQLPEGLKGRAAGMAEEIEKAGIETITSAEASLSA